MQETLYQTADAGNSLSDSGCRRLFRQRMQESLYPTAMQETLNQTADAGDSPSDSGCEDYQIADAGAYQTADAGDSLSDNG